MLIASVVIEAANAEELLLLLLQKRDIIEEDEEGNENKGFEKRKQRFQWGKFVDDSDAQMFMILCSKIGFRGKD